MNPLTHSFAPIAFMVSMSVVTGLGILVLSYLLSGSRRSHAADTIYECGLDPMDEPTKRFAVDFHVVAMLFILFDVEIALLVPWAVFYGLQEAGGAMRLLAFADFVVFVLILLAGYVYLYRSGVFDWVRAARRASRKGASS